MKGKKNFVIGTTLALPLLAPTGVESAADDQLDLNESSHFQLTESQLDAVTGGGHAIRCLCGVDWYHQPIPKPLPMPIWEPKPDYPPQVTTMAIGEEGGGISPIFW